METRNGIGDETARNAPVPNGRGAATASPGNEHEGRDAGVVGFFKRAWDRLRHPAEQGRERTVHDARDRYMSVGTDEYRRGIGRREPGMRISSDLHEGQFGAGLPGFERGRAMYPSARTREPERGSSPGYGTEHTTTLQGLGPTPLRGTTRRWNSGGLRAASVMTRSPRTVRPTDTVQRIAQMMAEEDFGIVPVTDETGRLLGVVTDRDIVCRMVTHRLATPTATARDVMTHEIECVTEQDDLRQVLHLMAEHQIRRLPVVGRGDRLVGIIAMADLAREADMDDQVRAAFEEISAERGFWSRLR